MAPAPVPAVVQVSLDSTPQDAEVEYVVSGEVVGRTPVTIAVPRGHVAVMFRFQKSGHEPTNYKVIPDLDKAVRVDLVAARGPGIAARAFSASGPPVRASLATKPRHPRAAAATTDSARAAAPRSRTTAPCRSDRFRGPSSGSTVETLASARRSCTTPVACGAHTLGLRRPDLKLDRSVAVTLAPDHELKQHYELDSNYSE